METRDSLKCQDHRCQNPVAEGRKFCSLRCHIGHRRGCPPPPPEYGAAWIELGSMRFALVDSDMEKRVNQWLWSKSRTPSGKILAHRWERKDGKLREVKLHRWIMEQFIGPIPEGVLVDHKNGDPLDCRLENLRAATPSQNAMNRKSISFKTGYRGVYPVPSGKFSARLDVKGKKRSLGLFDRPEDAARARDRAARLMFGQFAPMNFPFEMEESTVPLPIQVDEVRS